MIATFRCGWRRLIVPASLLALLLFVRPALAQTPSPQATARPVAAAELNRHGTPQQKAQSLFGLLTFTALCFGIGHLRRPRLKPLWRTVLWGLALQFVFTLLVLNTLGFVPGGTPPGSKMMGPVFQPSAYTNVGAFFAFNVLPTVIFFLASSTLLYFLRLLQPVVRGLA